MNARNLEILFVIFLFISGFNGYASKCNQNKESMQIFLSAKFFYPHDYPQNYLDLCLQQSVDVTCGLDFQTFQTFLAKPGTGRLNSCLCNPLSHKQL